MNDPTSRQVQTGTRWQLGCWALWAIGFVAACGGGGGSDDVAVAPTLTTPVTSPSEVATNLALLGELAAPADLPSTASEAQAVLTSWLPPDSPEGLSANFPPELLPPV